MIRKGGFTRPEHQSGPMLLVHGGAWDIPDEECGAHLAGMKKVLEIGRKRLLEGKNALFVAAEVVAAMESDGAFDAGRGAVLNKEGFVELDAGIMQGRTRHFGAVAGIKHFENPIQIARSIIANGKRQYCFLSGEGAEEFARDAGFHAIENDALICEREQKRYDLLLQQAGYHTSHPFLPGKDEHPQGTVGCVVLDTQGHLAAATSTGGTPFRPAGRIGDSPLPGCGFYASAQGAASATGWGEAIASVALCYDAVKMAGQDVSSETAATVIQSMGDMIKNEEGQDATGGIILLSKNGDGGFAFSTPRMARGGWYEGGEIWTTV